MSKALNAQATLERICTMEDASGVQSCCLRCRRYYEIFREKLNVILKMRVVDFVFVTMAHKGLL